MHMHTHHEDDNGDEIENCVLCELAIENQNSDAIITTPLVFTSPQVYNCTIKPFCSYILVLSSLNIHSSLFGRPPPSIA